MNKRSLFDLLNSGASVTTDDETRFRLPSVPTALREDFTLSDAVRTGVTVKHLPGPTNKIILTFNDLSVTVRNTEQGVGTKILDFPLGLFRIISARGSLTFTTTSVLADTLNLSKTINWAVGTATQTTTTLAGTPESDIIPVTAATSSATINTANTATIGEQWNPKLLDGATTAADLYLNISVPTANDIDADATVAINGTITIHYEDLGVTSALTHATRMPSAAIWKSCPWNEILAGQVDGHVYYNDFTEGGYTLAANQTTTKLDRGVTGWTSGTAGSTLSVLTTAPYGVVVLSSTTDNEGAGISILGSANAAGQIVFEAGKRVWFEARVKTVNITDSKYNLFVGFAEEALNFEGGIITTSDALTDKDLVGFQRVFADGDKLDVVHNTASGGGVTTAGADAVTVVADTWINIGIYCDGTTVYFYADGTEVDSVALTATNFPDGEEMAFYMQLMLGHADDATASIDWVRIAQQRA